MKSLKLLEMLGIKNYTQRHVAIIDNHIYDGESTEKKVLDALGEWDEKDLAIFREWEKTYCK